MKALFNLLLLTLAPAAAGYGGFWMTERVFRDKLIPFPSQPYGMAAAAACFFWTLSAVVLTIGRKKK